MSYRITNPSALPTWKWIDIYPTKEMNDSSSHSKQTNILYGVEYNMTNQECEWSNFEMCSTEVQRKCGIMCNKECPETCSEGGFLATIRGENYKNSSRDQ